MAKRKCSLCGGRLVNNRCTFCGLDNSIYDRDHSYRSAYAQQKKQEKKAERAPVKPAGRTAAQSGQRQTSAPRPAPASPGTKKRGCITWVIVIVIIVLAVIPALSDIGPSLIGRVRDALSDSGIFSDDTYDSQIYNDWSGDDAGPYAYVTRAIPESGESCEMTLGNGVYKVGVHIPEGVYHAALITGSGGLEITDDENSIYEYIYFGTDEEYDEVTEQDDIRLYNGAELIVDSGFLAEFSTQNAQPLTQEPQENPLTQTVSLPSGTYTAGVDTGADIPEGIYDISVTEETDDSRGYASIAMDYPNGSSHYFWADSSAYSVSSGEYTAAGIKNVVIPSGTEITVEYGDIVLTPSDGYYETDYSDYPN